MSGVNLGPYFSSIPEDLGSTMVGRCSPKSLDKLAQVSHEIRVLANRTALDRLNRSFGGVKTAFSHTKELYTRSVQWHTTLVEEAYAKLGKVTASLQTEKTCIVSIESPFLPQVKEMVILSPPVWEATFPLENSITQIVSFHEGSILVFTENGVLEKYVVRRGKIQERFLGENQELLPVIGLEIPFLFALSSNLSLQVIDSANLEFTSSFKIERPARAILHINSKFTLFFKDGCVCSFTLDGLGRFVNLEKPCRNFLSPLTQFKSVSTNFLETLFTVDTEQGPQLFFYDHACSRLHGFKKEFSFEKMIRIQEFLIGLHQNTLYFEAILDHKTFRLFSPKQGIIIDFCPSEEGILQVLVQQYHRLVLFRLVFPPHKKPFVDSDSQAY